MVEDSAKKEAHHLQLIAPKYEQCGKRFGGRVFKEQEDSKEYTSITKKKEKTHLEEDGGYRELRRITIPK